MTEEIENMELEQLQQQYNQWQNYGGNNIELPKWQLNMQEELEEFYRRLLAIRRNPQYDGEEDRVKFIRIVGAERVNDMGAIAIMGFLADRLTKITSDTKISEDIIKREAYESDNSFTEWLASKSNKYEIKSDQDYNMICESYVTLVVLALYRSLKGWKGDLINQHPTTREVVYREQDEQKKQAGFSLPFNYGGGN